MFLPETARPQLANVLLNGPNTLSLAARGLIGAFVSRRNDCQYCQTIHGAVAAHHLGGNKAVASAVKQDFEHAEVPKMLKTLLAIAAKVQSSGDDVTTVDIVRARRRGTTDPEIHVTVLIAVVLAADGYAAGTLAGAAAETT